MKKLTIETSYAPDIQVKNWKAYLTEQQEDLEEIKAKELKQQNPEYKEVISQIQQLVEPKYVHYVFSEYKKGSNVMGFVPSQDNDSLFSKIIPVVQEYDKLSKTGAIDRAIKDGEGDERYKNIDFWRKYEMDSLQTFLKTANQYATSTGEEKKQAKSASDKVYEDDRFLIISPRSHKASCFYGKGTRWCITEKNFRYWDQYTKENKFFMFVIDSKSPKPERFGKVAFARDLYKKDYQEVYDATDELIEYDEEQDILGQYYGEAEAAKLFAAMEKYSAERRKEGDEKYREAGGLLPGDMVKLSHDFYNELMAEIKKKIDSDQERAKNFWFKNRAKNGKPEEMTPEEEKNFREGLLMIKQFSIEPIVKKYLSIGDIDSFKKLRKLEGEVQDVQDSHYNPTLKDFSIEWLPDKKLGLKRVGSWYDAAASPRFRIIGKAPEPTPFTTDANGNPYEDEAVDEINRLMNEALMSEEELQELKAKELKQKYPEWKEVISQIQQLVPPKYVHFAFEAYKEIDEDNELEREWAPRWFELHIQPIIEKFDELSKAGAWDRAIKAGKTKPERKNIDWWTKSKYNIVDLKFVLDTLEQEFGKSERERTKVAKSQSEKVYEDERFLIISPLSHEASCFYGKGTKWCITDKNPGYWDNYTNKNTFFVFVVDSQSPNPARFGKIAFAYTADGEDLFEVIYDAEDRTILDGDMKWTNDSVNGSGGFGKKNYNRIYNIVYNYAEKRKIKEAPSK